MGHRFLRIYILLTICFGFYCKNPTLNNVQDARSKDYLINQFYLCLLNNTCRNSLFRTGPRLTAITIENVTLIPIFSPDAKSYSASLNLPEARVNVSWVTEDNDSYVEVNGNRITNNQNSFLIDYGENNIILHLINPRLGVSDYSIKITNPNAVKIFQSGASSCYNNFGASPCNVTASTHPLQDFDTLSFSRDRNSYNGPSTNSGNPNDMITTDPFAKLTWKTCPSGFAGSPPNCGAGTTTQGDYQSALTACENLNSSGFAGLSKWRLADFPELLRLVNLGASPPQDATFFPTGVNIAFWAANADPENTNQASIVDFITFGNLSPVSKSLNTNGTLCVSGEKFEYQRYQDLGNGVIREMRSGLSYQKCVADSSDPINCSASPTATRNWASALQYCESLSFGKRTDWRLPNILELLALVRFNSSANSNGKFIDSNFFPNNPNANINADALFSSSSWVTNSGNALTVRFGSQNLMNNTGKTALRHVRCIAGP